MDLLERMPLIHQDMIRRMLRTETIPKQIVLEYFTLRKYADRADIIICPSAIAQIVMKNIGERPEDMPPAPANLPVKTASEKEKPDTEIPVKQKEEMHEAPAEETVAEIAEAAFVEGQQVEVFADNQIMNGVIAGIAESGKYLVKLDERPETIEVTAVDIESA
jgi:hypothetical protein